MMMRMSRVRAIPLLAGAMFAGFVPLIAEATAAVETTEQVVPVIFGGDASGDPPDSADNHIDPNTTDSPFGGVGSFRVTYDHPFLGEQVVIGSGAAIRGFSPTTRHRRDYVLSAAHVFDYVNAGGDPVPDGVADVLPENVTFNLNFGGDRTHVITAAEIINHPDYIPGGIQHDDLALVRLSEPLPEGIPVYSFATELEIRTQVITMVGYGKAGDNSTITDQPSLTTKRVGWNQVDSMHYGDETPMPPEVFRADFDGPDETTNVYNIGEPGFDPDSEGTLGNEIEAIVASGDSGGPSFFTDSETIELELDSDGLPVIYGVNTFAAPGSNGSFGFGATMGGILVASYADWIDTQMQIAAVPEPVTAGLLAMGWLVLTGRRPRSTSGSCNLRTRAPVACPAAGSANQAV